MKSTPQHVLNDLQALIAGLKQRPPTDTLLINGKYVTVGDWIAVLAGDVTFYTKVVDAQSALDSATQARDAVAPTIIGRLSTTKTVLKASIGRQSPELSQYGLKADKSRRSRTLAEKTVAAGKGVSTRKARHTMGPRQKAAIHGVYPEPTPTTANDGGTTATGASESTPAAGTGTTG